MSSIITTVCSLCGIVTDERIMDRMCPHCWDWLADAWMEWFDGGANMTKAGELIDDVKTYQSCLEQVGPGRDRIERKHNEEVWERSRQALRELYKLCPVEHREAFVDGVKPYLESLKDFETDELSLYWLFELREVFFKKQK